MLAFRVSAELAEQSLKTVRPAIAAAVAVVQANGGRTELPAGLTRRLLVLGVDRWAELYLDTRKLVLMGLLGVYTPKQLEEIALRFAGAPEEDQTSFWESLICYLTTENWIDVAAKDFLEGLTPAELKEELEAAFSVAEPELRQETVLKVQASLVGMVASFHNAMAMLAYGAPMSDWVARASNGDVDAYYKAYHVDQTVRHLPCFVELHERKKEKLDGDFFNALRRRNRSPLIPARMKYPELWFAFAYLDSFGVLPSRDGTGFSMRRLLELLTELKLYGGDFDRGVDDLSKRLRDYRELQKKLKARKF